MSNHPTLCLVRRGYPRTVHADLHPHPLDVDYPVPACLPARRAGDLYVHVSGPPTCERCLAAVAPEDASEWIMCEGGCDRALPADEAEHAQCGSLLVYCSDCLADHARTCLVCGAA